MKKSLEDYRTMYYTVRDLVTSTPSVTIDLMPMFSDAFSAFETNLALIPDQSESQTNDRRGNRLIKDALKREMVIGAINLSARIKAFAENSEDVYLEQEMSKSFTAILTSADTVSADLCNFIISRASVRMPGLAPYGVTATMITELEDKINSFVAQIPKPRMGIIERKEATKQLEIIFKACNQNLKRMDTLVKMLRFEDSVFYDNYFSARRVIRTGKRTLAITGLVVDALGNPLEMVNVTLKNTSSTRKTSVNGVFEIKNVEAGIYQLVFARPGYVENTVEIAVTSTLTTEVNVTMQKVLEQSA